MNHQSGQNGATPLNQGGRGRGNWHGTTDPGRRAELRRPNQDDVSSQMAGMNLQGGDLYGIPQPAPNADGWSSGENNYDSYQQQQHYQMPSQSRSQNPNHSYPQQQHYQNPQQQQQQQQQPHQGYHFQPRQSNYRSNNHHQQQQQQRGGTYGNMSYRPNQQQQQQRPTFAAMNAGASEFVPLSNLNATANEFIPRHTPRNTSNWGYTQQSATPASDIIYDPMEELSKAISLLEFHPGKLELTSAHLTEVLRTSVPTVDVLKSVVSIIFEKCLSETNFRYTGARLFDNLSTSVNIEVEGKTFRTALLDQCKSIHETRKDLIASDPARFRSFTLFMADLFLQLGIYAGNVKERVGVLGNAVMELLSTLTKTTDKENLKTVAQTLGMSGSILEVEEQKQNDGKSPRLDALMEEIAKVAENKPKEPAASEEVGKSEGPNNESQEEGTKGEKEEENKKEEVVVEIPSHILQMLKDLSELRKNGWGLQSQQQQQQTQQPPQNNYANQYQGYQGGGRGRGNNTYYGGHGQYSGGGAVDYGDNGDGELTAEEIQFMAEQMGDNFDFDDEPEFDEMDPEIQDAFEEFMNSQGK